MKRNSQAAVFKLPSSSLRSCKDGKKSNALFEGNIPRCRYKGVRIMIVWFGSVKHLILTVIALGVGCFFSRRDKFSCPSGKQSV